VKKLIQLLSLSLLIAFVQGAVAFSQPKGPITDGDQIKGNVKEEESRKEEPADKKKGKSPIDFNLGIAPDLDGNATLNGTLRVTYFGWLTAGVLFTKNAIGEKEYNKKLDIRKITLIETQIARFNALGLKIPIIPKGNVTWTLKPGVNGQYLYQRQTFNLIQRKEDRYSYENSNLQFLQIGVDLESWLTIGDVMWYMGGSATPYSSHKESGIGYDKLQVQYTVGDLKNIVYTGNTGDYEYNTATKSLYWDAKTLFVFKNLVWKVGLVLGCQLMHLDYEFKASRATIENAEETTEKKTKSQDRLDITGIFGLALGFIDTGENIPIISVNFTRTNYLDAKGVEVTDNIIAIGISM